MTLIKQIKRDREAGTPGPWATDWTGCDFWCGPCTVLGGSRQSETDARRIARVPDMEAALLAADELASAASWLADSSQLEIGHDYDDGKDPLSVISNALAAYRAAVSGASK